MRRRLDLGFPRGPGWARFALLVSVALHVFALALWRFDVRLPEVTPAPRRTVTLIPLQPAPREDARARPAPPAEPRPVRRAPPPRPSVPARRPEPPAAPAPPRAPPVAAEPRVEPDSGAVPGPEFGSLRPDLAQGRLWVRPLPVPPQELAQRLRRTRAELQDSVVTEMVQAFLDSVAAAPSSRQEGLPRWVTDIGGKTFGLDSSNIYVAGLKIPAAVLALLPVPATGNPDQMIENRRIMDIRADIQYAAQRARNLEEFKIMIREMRERKERERQFERNQRLEPPRDLPDTLKATTSQ